MKARNKRQAIIAVALAAVIGLSGTFAWQSISQQALNEAKGISNPGGRLHDDYSGPDGNKDVYVENFGDQDIFARVRLFEYMEIGKGAGTKGTQDANGSWTASVDNKATSLVNGAEINDVSSWTLHLPGTNDENISTGDETKTNWANSTQTFHSYFTWTMGGEGDNGGQTVYLPTFNKNKDSLAADINGTLAGVNGVAYADYVNYADSTVYGVGKDVTGAAYYDADDDTTDEGNGTGNGNGGTQNTNYTAKEETHKIAKTLTASVITMATWNSMPDTTVYSNTDDTTVVTIGKDTFVGWVYDEDGWAYWSQPIKPGTATGLLLDKVSTKDKADEWYYGINVEAQFITANDLGQTGANATGFYRNEEEAPSANALALLARAGVNISGITLTTTESDTTTNVSGIVTVTPGSSGYTMTVTATAAAEVSSWEWKSSATSVATTSTENSETNVGKITVLSSADDGSTAIITVTAKDGSNNVIGSTTFTIKVGSSSSEET